MRRTGIKAGYRKMIEAPLGQLRLKLPGPDFVVRWEDRPAFGIAGRDHGKRLWQAALRQVGAEAGVAVGLVHCGLFLVFVPAVVSTIVG
jgi:hypothetical protein